MKRPHILIDPPTGPFGGVKKLEKWLARLHGLDEGEADVQSAIKQAERWLKIAEKIKEEE